MVRSFAPARPDSPSAKPLRGLARRASGLWTPMAGGGGADVPAPFQELIHVHYDATQLELEHGENVEVWPDLGPKGFDLLARGAAPPRLHHNAVNGRPSVYFERGRGDYLEYPWMHPNLDGFTMLGVLNCQLSPGQTGLPFNLTNTSGVNSTRVTAGILSGSWWVSSGNENTTVPGAASLGVSRLLSWKYLVNSSVNRALRISGEHKDNQNWAVQARSITLGDFPHGLNSTNSWTGYISEFLVYDRPLTNSEQEEAEAYLANKWNLPLDGSI